MDHRVEQSFNLQKLLAGNVAELTAALEARDVTERIERLWGTPGPLHPAMPYTRPPRLRFASASA